MSCDSTVQDFINMKGSIKKQRNSILEPTTDNTEEQTSCLFVCNRDFVCMMRSIIVANENKCVTFLCFRFFEDAAGREQHKIQDGFAGEDLWLGFSKCNVFVF